MSFPCKGLHQSSKTCSSVEWEFGVRFSPVGCFSPDNPSPLHRYDRDLRISFFDMNRLTTGDGTYGINRWIWHEASIMSETLGRLLGYARKYSFRKAEQKYRQPVGGFEFSCDKYVSALVIRNRGRFIF